MSPHAYLHLLRTVSPEDVRFGVGGLGIFRAEDIHDEQVGYSVDPDGVPLSGEDEGDWQTSWLVIGTELACGDPIFIDLVQPEMPVYTAMHGMGD